MPSSSDSMILSHDHGRCSKWTRFLKGQPDSCRATGSEKVVPRAFCWSVVCWPGCILVPVEDGLPWWSPNQVRNKCFHQEGLRTQLSIGALLPFSRFDEGLDFLPSPNVQRRKECPCPPKLSFSQLPGPTNWPLSAAMLLYWTLSFPVPTHHFGTFQFLSNTLVQTTFSQFIKMLKRVHVVLPSWESPDFPCAGRRFQHGKEPGPMRGRHDHRGMHWHEQFPSENSKENLYPLAPQFNLKSFDIGIWWRYNFLWYVMKNKPHRWKYVVQPVLWILVVNRVL